MNPSSIILNNTLAFLERVQTTGKEAIAWVECSEFLIRLRDTALKEETRLSLEIDKIKTAEPKDGPPATTSTSV